MMLVALIHLAVLSVASEATPIAPAPPIGPMAAPPSPIEIHMRPLPTSGTPPLIVPKGTRASIEIDAQLSSDQSQPGTRFAIRLADDVVIDGWPVLMAGASGEGEVVHAAKAGWGGKAGELIINARFLDCGTVKLPLGKMHFSRGGENRTGTAMAAIMVFTPAMFMVSGGNLSVPRGTRADAAILSDVSLASVAGTRCAAPANLSKPAVE